MGERMEVVRRSLILCSFLALLAVTATAPAVLPSGWTLSPPIGDVAETGTMPQGLALSPDGTQLAVLESGFNPPALRILATSDLHVVKIVALRGAFGKPVWRNGREILVAGANAGAVLRVDAQSGAIAETAAAGWPATLAVRGNTVAVASDTGNAVQISRDGAPPAVVATGTHPGDAVFTHDGKMLFVSNRGEATVTAIDVASHTPRAIAVDLHPAALALSANGGTLYVACADADTVDAVDTQTLRVVARVNVGLPQGPGASPNALALSGNTIYVSLGAENAVAEIRNGRVVARVPAGWYPTGVAVRNGTIFVADGKGEGSRANPDFDPRRSHSAGYVAATLAGSVRAVNANAFDAASTATVLEDIPKAPAAPSQTVLRARGPIAHVFYIIKENRTYDQVLGDLDEGDGDSKLTWFGAGVTPNQHAIARRFGLFDEAFTDAQVSANGHNWSTAAFANDYLERFWPPNYGGRRSTYDFEDSADASTPKNGYLWDDAKKNGVSLRDYGEFVSPSVAGMYASHMPGLQGAVDPHYPGFDLDISDEARVDEWQREFDDDVRAKSLPALEIIRLPNDHTSGTRPDALTPQAFVAQNDHAFGRIVESISHSPYWASSAIFAIEDDAQNGPDHVGNQRTTLYVASPYASAGVHHAHYTTSSLVRTIEVLLGLPPMSIYDAVAPPLYDAFGTVADDAPFSAIAPRVDVNAKNLRTAYGAKASSRMDFSRADAADPAALNDILAHAARWESKP